MLILQNTDPMAVAAIEVIHGGDIEGLRRLLQQHPELATSRTVNAKGSSGTLLHAVADWPGFFPNGPEIVALLLAAGADPNAPIMGGSHSETPLHWAASSDDVDVAEALIAGGADIEARGASIAGGTPLDDALAYGCWEVARLLRSHGARVNKLWHAAALGMVSRLAEFFAEPSPPAQKDVNDAFWQACHGGQRRAAEFLLARGADLNWVPDYAKQTPLDIASKVGTGYGRGVLVSWLRKQGAASRFSKDIKLSLNPGVELKSTETAGIARAFPLNTERRFDLTWDRFNRLFQTAKAVKARAEAGTRVLDVGGFDGALALFLPEFIVDVIDPITTGGTGLEIPACEYSVVVSIDALEHVEPELRKKFLSELSRVSKKYCFINFPARRSSQAQQIVFDLTANPLIEEHVIWELPHAAEVSSHLKQAGFKTETIEHTSLSHWLSQYLLQTLLPDVADRTTAYLHKEHPEEPTILALYDLVVGSRE